MSVMSPPEPRFSEFLYARGLAARDARIAWTPLAGGISSEIWRVDLPDRTLCVKCALPRLKVAADWRVPISRNAYEWAWMRFAARHCPGAAPTPIAHDPEQGILAMSFLDPRTHPLWKGLLLAGVARSDTAASVARVLVRLHAASAHQAELEREFPSIDNFHALRLEPYLLATGQRHPDLAPLFRLLADRTGAARIALVHGDVSPKNLLIGVDGPVFLDAECAWYGDPAFDVAFCLNHFLLKCLARPASSEDYLRCFAAFSEGYRSGVTWEPPDDLEARAASLLPALFLARVDGKSPVEYITDDRDRELVRNTARPLVAVPPTRLMDVAERWRTALGRHCSR